MRVLAACVGLLLAACSGATPDGPTVRVGSKKFTESVILVVSGLFELIERLVVPRGLRL